MIQQQGTVAAHEIRGALGSGAAPCHARRARAHSRVRLHASPKRHQIPRLVLAFVPVAVSLPPYAPARDDHLVFPEQKAELHPPRRAACRGEARQRIAAGAGQGAPAAVAVGWAAAPSACAVASAWRACAPETGCSGSGIGSGGGSQRRRQQQRPALTQTWCLFLA